jgi:hypothetical protein
MLNWTENKRIVLLLNKKIKITSKMMLNEFTHSPFHQFTIHNRQVKSNARNKRK